MDLEIRAVLLLLGDLICWQIPAPNCKEATIECSRSAAIHLHRENELMQDYRLLCKVATWSGELTCLMVLDPRNVVVCQ